MPSPATLMGPAGALARLARGPDAEAWESLARAFAPEVSRLCASICGESQLAQDAVQETWLLLRDRAGRFAPRGADPDTDAHHWIVHVAANTALQVLRRHRRALRRDARAPAPRGDAPRPDEALLVEERARLIRGALAALPEPLRNAVALHHLGGMEFVAVAEALRCPVGTAKVWVHRGIARLRRQLKATDVHFSAAVLAALGASAPSGPSATVPSLAAPGLATTSLPTGGAGIATKLVAVVTIALAAGATTVALAPTRTPATPSAPSASTHATPSAPIASSTAAAAGAVDPEVDAWQRHLLDLGRTHARWLHEHRDDPDLGALLRAIDFDAAAVYFRTAERTGDRSWEEAAQDALHIYRDRYLVPRGGAADGYRVLPDGLELDARRGGERSRDALIAMSRHAKFLATANDRLASSEISQEVAELIRCLLAAERLGAPQPERLRALVDLALGHLERWRDGRWRTFEPCRFAVTARALIEYDAAHPDPRIAPALGAALDWLWSSAWLPGPGSFRYSLTAGDPHDGPAPDLDPLLAPAFAWMRRHDPDPRWGTRADAIFASGVDHARLDALRQFVQSYWWSFDYVAWRGAAPPTSRP